MASGFVSNGRTNCCDNERGSRMKYPASIMLILSRLGLSKGIRSTRRDIDAVDVSSETVSRISSFSVSHVARSLRYREMRRIAITSKLIVDLTSRLDRSRGSFRVISCTERTHGFEVEVAWANRVRRISAVAVTVLQRCRWVKYA